MISLDIGYSITHNIAYRISHDIAYRYQMRGRPGFDHRLFR